MHSDTTASPDPILLELPDQLSTPRLLLRPPQAGDGLMLHEAIVETLPELRRFLATLPWVAAEPNRRSAEAFCRQGQANFLARRDFPFLLLERASGRLVGVAGLHRSDFAVPKSEVGYWSRASTAGQGYISEAVRALAGLAFDALGMVRLEAVIDEANAASRRVVERCGFVLEGIHRHDRRASDGTLRNTCIYARCDFTR